MNGNKLSAIQQDSKQILAKSKSLLDITRKILAEKSNRDVTKNFTHKFFYLQGHISTVTSLAITSDDKKIVSGSDDKTIKIWDISSGMCIKTLEGHTNSVTCLIITPDGKHIVSGSHDKTLKLWELHSGKEIRSFEGHTNWVTSIAITPDGKYIVSGSQYYRQSDKTIKLWDIQSGKEIRSFEGHTDHVNSIAITPDGKYIVSGSDDKTIKIWDISNGVCIKTLEGHNLRVNCIVIIDNGKKIISGSHDKTIKIWDMLSGECIDTVNNIVNYSTFNITPDEKKIVCVENSVISLWDIESLMCLGRLFGHSNRIASLVVSPDGKQIVSGSFDKTIKIWDIQNATVPKIYEMKENIYCFSGNYLITNSSEEDCCTYCIRDLESGQSIFTIDADAVDIIPDDKKVLTTKDKTIKLWDIESGQEIQSFEGYTSWVNSIAITPDGKYFVSSGNLDKTIKIWDISSGMCIKTLEGHTKSVNSVAITPDGKHIVSGSNDKTIKIWDISSGVCTRTLEGEYYFITPDSKKIVSDASGHTAVWDIESGEIKYISVHTMKCNQIVCINNMMIFGHYLDIEIFDIESGRPIYSLDALKEGNISNIKISPDGKQLISASNSYYDDTYLQVWDLDSRRCTHTFLVNSDYLFTFTPDSKNIVIANNNNIEIWEINSGLCTRTFETLNCVLEGTVTTPNGKQIVSYGGIDKIIKFWDIVDGSCVKTLNGFLYNNTKFVITPCSKWLFAISNNHFECYTEDKISIVQIWDITNCTYGKTLWYSSGVVSNINIMPDNKKIVFLWQDHRDMYKIVLDIETGDTVEYDLDDYQALAITSNGEKYVTDEINITDIESGKYLITPKEDDNYLDFIAITPDNQRVVSKGQDNTIKILDMLSGECLKSFKVDLAMNTINTTGEYIFSKNTDKIIHVWDIKSGEKIHEVIKPSRDALVALYKNEQLIGFVE